MLWPHVSARLQGMLEKAVPVAQREHARLKGYPHTNGRRRSRSDDHRNSRRVRHRQRHAG
jgi:hypothetical protein